MNALFCVAAAVVGLAILARLCADRALRAQGDVDAVDGWLEAYAVYDRLGLLGAHALADTLAECRRLERGRRRAVRRRRA